jgi:hypothetical protein
MKWFQFCLLFGVHISFSRPNEANHNETTFIEGKFSFRFFFAFLAVKNFLLISTCKGFFLCKLCGSDNSILNLIINDRISEQAQGVSNVTINNKNIVLQLLKNPAGVQFKVFLTKKATCAKTTGWYPSGSWFDGYGWKVCQCPSCKNHMGWMFERIETIIESNPLFPGEKGFYGIIYDSVITESCK